MLSFWTFFQINESLEIDENGEATSSMVIISPQSDCSKCVDLRKEKKNLHSKLRRLQSKLKQLQHSKTENQARWVSTVETIVRNDEKEMQSTG